MVDQKPSIIIPNKSYEKVMNYVKGCDSEISGFFDVEWDKTEGAFVMGEVYLIDQECTGTETEMEEEAIAKFSYELIKKGVKQLPRGWWHSHVNMGAFWSSTDTATQEQLKNESYSLSIVINKRAEMKAKIWVTNPFEFSIDDLDIEIMGQEDNIPASIKREIAKKVKTKTYTPQTYVPSYDYDEEDYYGHGGFHKRFKEIGASLTYKNRNLTLPKAQIDALEKIDALNLVMKHDETKDLNYFEDPYTMDKWWDTWKTISTEDYEMIIKGREALESTGGIHEL